MVPGTSPIPGLAAEPRVGIQDYQNKLGDESQSPGVESQSNSDEKKPGPSQVVAVSATLEISPSEGREVPGDDAALRASAFEYDRILKLGDIQRYFLMDARIIADFEAHVPPSPGGDDSKNRELYIRRLWEAKAHILRGYHEVKDAENNLSPLQAVLLFFSDLCYAAALGFLLNAAVSTGQMLGGIAMYSVFLSLKGASMGSISRTRLLGRTIGETDPPPDLEGYLLELRADPEPGEPRLKRLMMARGKVPFVAA